MRTTGQQQVGHGRFCSPGQGWDTAQVSLVSDSGLLAPWLLRGEWNCSVHTQPRRAEGGPARARRQLLVLNSLLDLQRK